MQLHQCKTRCFLFSKVLGPSKRFYFIYEYIWTFNFPTEAPRMEYLGTGSHVIHSPSPHQSCFRTLLLELCSIKVLEAASRGQWMSPQMSLAWTSLNMIGSKWSSKVLTEFWSVKHKKFVWISHKLGDLALISFGCTITPYNFDLSVSPILSHFYTTALAPKYFSFLGNHLKSFT